MRPAPVALALLLLLTGTVCAEDPPPTLQQLRSLAWQGHLARAVDGARALTAADPRNLAAARLLQDLLVEAGRADEARAAPVEGTPTTLRRALAARLDEDARTAIAVLAELLKDDDAPPLLRLDLALRLVDADRAGQAETEVQRYLRDRPEDVEGLVVLGCVQVARSKRLAARATFEEILAAQPGMPGPAVALAGVHAEDGRDEDARAVLARALELYPANARLLRALAEDQVRTGELEPALATLQKLLATPVAKVPVHVRMAEIHRLRKAWPEAERCAGLALAEEAANPRALRVLGFVQQKRDDLAGALETYQKARDAAPDWAQIHADIGLVLMLQGENLPAERALQKALELDEELFDAHLALGMVQYVREKPKLARKELDWVLKRDKDNLQAHRTMGYLLLEEGKPKNALHEFQEVSELDPKDSSSVRMMGRCYMTMGRIEDAIASFQEAITRDAKDGFAYFDLGRAFEHEEKWEDAAAAYRKAISVDVRLPHPRLYLAELLDEVLDEPEEALQHYKAYLELGGNGEGGWIKKRIEQLERDVAEKKK